MQMQCTYNPGHTFLPNRCHYESVVNDRSCHPPAAPLQPPSQCWMWSLVASETHPTLGEGWEGVGGCGGREGGAWANLELIARYTSSGWVIIAIFFLHILLCVGNKPIKFHKDWPSGLPIKNYTIRCYELQDTLWQIYFDQDCLSQGKFFLGKRPYLLNRCRNRHQILPTQP